ncbi:MAG: hypothetical protein HKUEN07_01390 [Rhodocyclaceae bacterium]|uniref:Uncharacterized protein n=1 Tax=Candidatus Desulfobacillus denitrificans TaxID=2608985 RepID=A0A809R0B4_9PROT|nr:hypothetical protein [Rhodocyclaceae bacterium]BBO21083.1 conserved hypothetical protein [Candidatus Desulfobacillus denitrificans]GIK46961.1 MAG: hypothetical protein BroJett012_28640 [Betaproteobacteria bacterium]GJQ53570.1 MAG: hypothetical protein HKUEN07_01390 [Rhodocyclaceae bacterium]
MKHLVQSALAAIALMCSIGANAGTQALGFEIGASTIDQVKSTLVKQTKVADSGTNKFTMGPMLKTDGASYEIEGLNEVLYIFDDQKKLAGIIMDMNKARFDAIFQALSAKYKVSSQQRPFVGNQFARFKTQDSVIEMDAPHLGFVMEVRYIRNDLMQKFNSQSAAEADAKKKREAAKF